MKAGEGTPPNRWWPDNDYAIGEVVETISHSPIWKTSAIFIIEDDAQSGEDHVDAPTARRASSSARGSNRTPSTIAILYNTDSVLKTMELLLGIGPMTQYEATIAAAIDDWDAGALQQCRAVQRTESIFPAEESDHRCRTPEAAKLSSTDPRRRLIELSTKWTSAAPMRPPRLCSTKSSGKVSAASPPKPPHHVGSSNALPIVKDADDDDDEAKDDE